MFNTLRFKLLCGLVLPFITLVSSSVLGYEYVYIKFISPFFYKKDKSIEDTNDEVEGWNLTDLRKDTSKQHVDLKSAVARKTSLNAILSAEEKKKMAAKDRLDTLNEAINKAASEILESEKKLIELKNTFTEDQVKKTTLENNLLVYAEQLKVNEVLLKAAKAKKTKNEDAIKKAKQTINSSKSKVTDIEEKVEKQKVAIATKKAAYEKQLEAEQAAKVAKDNAAIAYIEANRKHDEQVAFVEKTFKDKTEKQTAIANWTLDLESKEAQVPVKEKAHILALDAKEDAKPACENAVKTIDPTVNCENDNFKKPELMIASIPYRVLQGLSNQATSAHNNLAEEIKQLKAKIAQQTKIKEQLTKTWELAKKNKNQFLKEKNSAAQAQSQKNAAYASAVTKTASLQAEYQKEIPKLGPLNDELSKAQEEKARQEDLLASLEIEETNIDKEIAALTKEAQTLSQNKTTDTKQLGVVTQKITNNEKEIAKESQNLEEKLDEQGTNKLLISGAKSSLSAFDESIKKNQKSIQLMEEFISSLTSKSEEAKKQLIALDSEISKSNSPLFKP